MKWLTLENTLNLDEEDYQIKLFKTPDDLKNQDQDRANILKTIEDNYELSKKTNEEKHKQDLIDI